MRSLLTLLFVAILALPAAQAQLADKASAVQKMAEQLLTDTSRTARQAKAEEILQALQDLFKMPGAYEYPFTEITSVSLQAPQDKSFRVATWQLFVDDNTYKYYGLLVMPDGKSHVLVDGTDELPYPEQSVLTPKKWYGALYYRIIDFKKGNEKMYALMGYDAHSFFTRRKVMDVLYFDNGKPKFGAPVIEFPDIRTGQMKLYKRFLIEYSAEVAVTLNWSDQFEMIVFDHLISAGGLDGGPVNVPDGSYSGFKLKKGIWTFQDQLWENAAKLEDGQAPIPFPKKEKDGLFGEK
jgi:hypothetical protein